MPNVSVSFFTAVVEVLVKQYGNRSCDGDKMNEIAEHLTQVEKIYQTFEEVPEGEGDTIET
jgi:hypothetical protein